ncbi:hypothetical protein [Caballeronia sp. LZ035]|uniref:hypothetical protein n=1 Tax=Caballeronia sp. LZ035 TaxID=3038568 RepID=UPI00285D8F54|nr:hypothetical protein [Caballeronia sp. LZ035]MDR5762968.1 hypothetical protein [Caballeronia sp. LZ035]
MKTLSNFFCGGAAPPFDHDVAGIVRCMLGALRRLRWRWAIDGSTTRFLAVGGCHTLPRGASRPIRRFATCATFNRCVDFAIKELMSWAPPADLQI